MLTEPVIDKSRIQTTIEESYGLKVSELSFVQGGQASWGYKVFTKDNNRYFFKIHANLHDSAQRFDLTYKLFTQAGITNITHPLKTKNGELVVQLDSYPAALFNFIPGHNASEQELTEPQRVAFGELLGRIHKAHTVIGAFALKEDFAYQNTPRLLANIQNASTFSKSFSHRQKTTQLLLEYKEKILSTVHVLEEQGAALRSQNLDFVICHGEPHRWNTMVNEQGEVFLIDWDDSLFAPKEKDLNMIKEDPLKLKAYENIVGAFSINDEVIRYYTREWNLSEIDAWSDKILHEDSNDTQNDHDLAEFTKVLEELDSYSISNTMG